MDHLLIHLQVVILTISGEQPQNVLSNLEISDLPKHGHYLSGLNYSP